MGTIKGEIGRHEEVYKPAPAPWTQSTSSVRQLLKCGIWVRSIGPEGSSPLSAKNLVELKPISKVDFP